MGNLSLENNRRSYSRRPIFKQDNSFYHDHASRSMSPYLLKTSRSNIYKSTISKRRMNVCGQKSPVNNRIYLNPALVKSVIKDTSNPDIVRTDNKRLKKSVITNMSTSLILPTKAFNQTRQFFGGNKMYEEKPFQQSSPTKEGRREKERREAEQELEKENTKTMMTWRDNLQKLKSPRVFTSSSLNKSNVSLSKFLGSGCSSTRNYGADGHLLPQIHQCCHQHLCLSQKQKTMLCDNAPTERKRSTRTQEPFQQIMGLKVRANRTKADEQPDFNYETGKKAGHPSSIHNQNREKCQQIIKRVRNFNEFLNQIKSKIKKEYSNLTSNHNTIENISLSEQQQQSFNRDISLDHQQHNNSIGTQMQESKTNHSKSITLALRLENEKIQLEKYRKLVERELSKQHSIQSIEIESKNKQKIITINFEKAGQSEANSQKTKNTKNEHKEQGQMGVKKTYKVGKAETIKGSKTKGVGQDGQKIQKRMSKINNLFTKMQGMNQAQIEQYKQISQILNDQESADSTV